MTEERTKRNLEKGDVVRRVSSQSRVSMLASRKRVRLRQIAFATGMTMLGFLLAGAVFPMKTMPLGAALVSALPGYSFFALLGICLRAWVISAKVGAFPQEAICAAVIWIVRLGMCLIFPQDRRMMRKTGRFSDAVSTRVLLATAAALTFAFVRMVRGGIEAASFLALALDTVCVGVFSFLFCFFFEAEYRNTPMFEAGLGAVAFAICFSFADVQIGGFSLGVFVATLITLYVGYLGQATRSSAVGLLCGLSLGGLYAPAFALSGLAAGVFFGVNAFLAAVSAVAVSIFAAMYFGGAEAILAMLPEVLLASALVTVPAMLEILPDFAMRMPREAEGAEHIVTTRREEERKQRMNLVSRSMSALSDTMHAVSEKLRRPAPEILSERCSRILHSHCSACPHENTCGGLETLEVEKLTAKIASRLMACGRIDRDRLYEMTSVKCPYLDVIAAELSVCSARMTEEAMREDTSRIFALDYEAMARMFADAAADDEHRYPVDRVLSERLHRHLLRAGVEAENVVVCGERKKFVVATGPKITHMTLRPSDLSDICENVCKMKFSMPEFMLERGRGAMTMESIPNFSVRFSEMQLSRTGETVCGDSISTLQNYDDYFYGFICDGMGSGEGASETAEMCRVFLEKMLACGNGKSTILSMLNTLLGARKNECFATVDLLEIDLVTGEAAFLKSGAVPSYVLRGETLLRVSSDTYPIGIMPSISSEMTCLSLREGDLILLCSDGVCRDAEENADAPWFEEILRRRAADDTEEIAREILRCAQVAEGYGDDMSVVVMRIEGYNR